MIARFLEGLSLAYRAKNVLQVRSAGATAMAHHRRTFYEQAWRDAAADLGCTIAPLAADIFQVDNGARSIRVCLNYSPLDDSVTLRLAGHKPAVYKLLAADGVPVPRHIVVDRQGYAAAAAFLRSAAKPIVVKPAYGTGAGAGVTTNVAGTWQLLNAMAWSLVFCPEIIIEEQIAGENYRLLYLDGALIDCIVRKPPKVIGDGTASIRQLVRRENQLRARTGLSLAQALLPVDLDMRNSLAAQGKSLSTIPAKGEVILVKTVINGNRAEENESVSVPPSPLTVAMGRRVVERLGVRLAGVDIITPDLGTDIVAAGGAMVDVNTTPGHYYHAMKKGQPFSAARAVLRAALGKVHERKVADG
jgi:cyanophycin synthetase